MTQWGHYQFSRFACVTETINLSLKQMCDCGCGQRTDYLSFWMALFVDVNQPWPDSISYSTVAAWRLSWGSGQKCLLIRLFVPAAHSWRVFASKLPEDCVSGTGEVGGANPLDDSHFFFIWTCQTVSASFCSSRRCRMSSSLFERDVSLVGKCRSSSVYAGLIDTPLCSAPVFRFIQTEYKELSQD